MKTAEEILKEHIGHAHGLMDYTQIKAMKAYAKQVSEQALKDASDNVNLQRDWKSSDGRITETEYMDGCSIGAYRYTVNKQSILQTEIKLP